MRIPDEGLLKKGQKSIEDIQGYVFCPHCNKCVITDQNDIYRDGLFYCKYEERWRRGDELVEFMCYGYHAKSCSSCEWIDCKNKHAGLYCRQYARIDISKSNRDTMMIGRRKKRAVSDSEIKSEELYVKFKTKQYEQFYKVENKNADNQRDGDEEDGKSSVEEEGDAAMGDV